MCVTCGLWPITQPWPLMVRSNLLKLQPSFNVSRLGVAWDGLLAVAARPAAASSTPAGLFLLPSAAPGFTSSPPARHQHSGCSGVGGCSTRRPRAGVPEVVVLQWGRREGATCGRLRRAGLPLHPRQREPYTPRGHSGSTQLPRDSPLSGTCSSHPGCQRHQTGQTAGL